MYSTNKWDLRFIEMAKHIAQWSKDPGTKVGAVIVRPNRTIASVGYNGLPRGISDEESILADRSMKLALTVHAEANAIIHAREPLDGCTIYTWPFQPCSHCAAKIIQAGIQRVVAPNNPPANKDWWASFILAKVALKRAIVVLDFVPPEGQR